MRTNMARYEAEFREFGKVIARARNSQIEAVMTSLDEQIDEKYNGCSNVRKTTKRR